MKGKYLITTHEWFYAPDGKQYRAVWGDVQITQTKDIIGLDPNRVTSNYCYKVGTEEHHIIIGGCQVMYSVKCDIRPETGEVTQAFEGEKRTCEPAIFIPEEVQEPKGDTELIDGKMVQWEYCQHTLLNILKSMDLQYFSGSKDIKEDTILSVESGRFKAFRRWRPCYKRHQVLEIKWLSDWIERFEAKQD